MPPRDRIRRGAGLEEFNALMSGEDLVARRFVTGRAYAFRRLRGGRVRRRRSRYTRSAGRPEWTPERVRVAGSSSSPPGDPECSRADTSNVTTARLPVDTTNQKKPERLAH